MRIERGKHNRLGPYHPEIFCRHRHWKNVLCLTSPPIESRQFAADDDVWIEWIRNDVTIFLSGHGSPVAERNLAVVAAALNSDRTAFLLTAVKSVRKRVVRTYMIQLRRRLVVPRAPTLPAIHGDDRALVHAQQNDVRIIRINPNVLIIVTAWRAAPTIPGFPAIVRFPTNDAGRVNDLRIFGIELQHGQIAPANSKPGAGIISCPTPGLAAVIRTIKFCDGLCFDRSEKHFRRARGDREIRLYDVVRQTFVQLAPRVTAIDRFENT